MDNAEEPVEVQVDALNREAEKALAGPAAGAADKLGMVRAVLPIIQREVELGPGDPHLTNATVMLTEVITALDSPPSYDRCAVKGCPDPVACLLLSGASWDSFCARHGRFGLRSNEPWPGTKPVETLADALHVLAELDLKLYPVGADRAAGLHAGKIVAEAWRAMEKEVEAVISNCGDDAVRVREGGGPENLAASLALTVARVRSSRDEFKAKAAELDETWYEPVEHGPDAWRRPTAEAYARVCVLLRKAEAARDEFERKGLELCQAFGSLLMDEQRQPRVELLSRVHSLRSVLMALRDDWWPFVHGAKFASEHALALFKRATDVLNSVAPLPIVTSCPDGHPHVDEGEWATKPHRTHQCQQRVWNPTSENEGFWSTCGKEWRPASVPTVGVLRLP